MTMLLVAAPMFVVTVVLLVWGLAGVVLTPTPTRYVYLLGLPVVGFVTVMWWRFARDAWAEWRG